MSKRLKRRIFDICGLTNLGREAKLSKAKAILADPEFKQKICNQIVGASHRDIEKVLKSVLVTKLSKEEEEAAELERDCPEKLNPDIKLGRKKKKAKMVPVTDQREINWLINATNEPLEDKLKAPTDYPCYSQAEMNAIIAGTYDPKDF